MGRIRRVAVCACVLTALSMVGTVSGFAVLPASAAPPAPCEQSGPPLRYLVVFDQGTTEQAAGTQISASCGTTVVYYPQISVAVATATGPGFTDRIGFDRAYSAEAEAVEQSDARVAKADGTERARAPVQLAPEVTGRASDQWNMRMIGAPAAHRFYTGSRDVVVGILDSGVDPTHPALRAALDPKLSTGCLSGRPDSAERAWTPTGSPHGTHVAGTVAAAGGTDEPTGVAPGVRIASVKVVDDEGYIYPEAAMCGLLWAADHKFTITNNSYFVDPWRFTCPDVPGQWVVYTAIKRAVDYATNQGVLTVAAAGNSGVDLSTPGIDLSSPDNVPTGQRPVRTLGPGCTVLPAGLHGVVTVSAVDRNQAKASYSGYGLGVIDVAAPGGDADQDQSDCVLSTIPGGYGRECGTSMAAPHAAGVAALLASTHPRSTPAQLKKMLDAQAQPLPCPANYDPEGTGAQDGYCTGYSAYNSFYGHGLVNALAAVQPDQANPLDPITH